MNERNKRIEDRSGCWDQRIGKKRSGLGTEQKIDWKRKDWEGRKDR
jgi:hypothetical protein